MSLRFILCNFHKNRTNIAYTRNNLIVEDIKNGLKMKMKKNESSSIDN